MRQHKCPPTGEPVGKLEHVSTTEHHNIKELTVSTANPSKTIFSEINRLEEKTFTSICIIVFVDMHV